MRILFLLILSLLSVGISAQTKFQSPVRDASFTIDSLYFLYAKEGYYTIVDDVEAFQYYMIELDRDSQLKELERLKAAAGKYESKELMKEYQYLDLILIPCKAEYNAATGKYICPDLDKIIEGYRGFIKEAVKDDDILFKLRMVLWLFRGLCHDISESKYAQAFELAKYFQDDLDNVSLEVFPLRSFSYYALAELYYKFDNYDEALPLISKALEETPYYFDYGSMAANNMLGLYYRQDNIEASNHFFRTILEQEKNYSRKAEYISIARNNLAYNLFLQNKYSEALSLFSQAITPEIREKDEYFTSGIYANMGSCYLELNNLEMTKNMIDSSLYYLRSNNFKKDTYYTRIYKLMSKYYASINESELSHLYLDSAFIANERHEQRYNYSSILEAEQTIFNYQQQIKDNELSYKNRLLVLHVILLLTISFGLIVAIVFYRKKYDAYETLVDKSRKWAAVDVYAEPIVVHYKTEPNQETKEDNAMKQLDEKEWKTFQKLNELILDEKLFQYPDLSLDYVAQKVGLNRYLVSKIINKATGKNFNAFINEYRIKEAIKLLSDTKNNNYTIDAIAFDCGFSNRISFYRSFKKETGISPTEFKGYVN